ncbi:unnamed protein product [Prorocentrum cordatum]|uniref:Uncharacterized protein n=1 Tax=Prorocentrum cordatum TaxID=2364126 RepID=A0ABN9X0E8_9DINO|nr:unnamed protein product [Polarella glacialis]
MASGPDAFVDCDEEQDGEVENKRPRATDADLEDLRQHVDNTKAEVKRSLAAVLAGLASVGNSFTSHCQTLDLQMERRLNQINEEIRVQNTKITALQEDVRDLRQLLGAVRAEKPEVTAAAAGGNGGFERKTDSTIVTLRTKDAVPKQSALVGFQPVLETANIPTEDVDIEGDPLSKKFQIRFKGAAGYATRRVNQTLSAMRALGPQGGWRQLTAKTATNGDAPTYVSSDKNAFQIQHEIGLKRLRGGLEELCLAGDSIWIKSKARCLNWEVLVRLTPKPGQSEPPLLEWAKNHIEAAGLDKAQMAAKCESLFSQAAAPEWCL